MKKIITVGIIMLFLGSSIPALAKNQSALSTPMPPISTSSGENYNLYIGAGFFPSHEGKFGFGWHVTVENIGDTYITGVFYSNETTVSGKEVDFMTGHFSLPNGTTISHYHLFRLDFHPITVISIIVVIGNMTYSKSGYTIGPFVLLTG